MELKLIKIKDREGLYYEKEYKYGKFNISVDIDIYNPNIYMIEAEDEKQNCTIMMSNYDNHAVMNFPIAYVTLKNADEFLEITKQGIEILNILNERRAELVEKVRRQNEKEN